MKNKETIMTGWHLDKRVSVTHLISTALLAGTVMVWMFALEGRVAINEVKIVAIQKHEDTTKSEIRAMSDSILNKLGEMEARQYEHVLEHGKQ